ncbi:MAG: hypothetical protein KTR29_05750 [Rhodothermaceae bacterium]|nr:hypothetical protein [Rhodothermaceae bacterium]
MRFFSATLKGAFVIVLLFCGVSTSWAQDSTCVDIVPKAEQAYFNIQFERAIELLEPCIESDEEVSQQQDVYLMLARIYFSTQEIEKSRSAIHNVLMIGDSFTLPEFLPPPFIEFFSGIEEQFSQHLAIAEKLRPAPEYRPPSLWQRIDRHWYWVGGGVLVAGAAAFLTDSDLEPAVFARPPAPPGGGEAPSQ